MFFCLATIKSILVIGWIWLKVVYVKISLNASFRWMCTLSTTVQRIKPHSEAGMEDPVKTEFLFL